MGVRIEEPQQRISREAVKVWRISAFIFYFVTLLIVGGFYYVSHLYHWLGWIRLLSNIVFILAAVRALYKVLIYPVYFQKTWRYAIGEQFIQLKYGVIDRKSIIVPMTKVQYVSTHQGPLLRHYGLSTIAIGTMASSHEIPALPEHEAILLRTRIAFLAKINEDE